MTTLLCAAQWKKPSPKGVQDTVWDPFSLPAPALVAARPAAVVGPTGVARPTAASAAPATAAIAPATASVAPATAAMAAAYLYDLDYLRLRGPTTAPAAAAGPRIWAPATAAAADPGTWAPATTAVATAAADPGTRAPAAAAYDASRAAGNEGAEYNKQFHRCLALSFPYPCSGWLDLWICG